MCTEKLKNKNGELSADRAVFLIRVLSVHSRYKWSKQLYTMLRLATYTSSKYTHNGELNNCLRRGRTHTKDNCNSTQ
jgi:hypothetical protein